MKRPVKTACFIAHIESVHKEIFADIAPTGEAPAIGHDVAPDYDPQCGEYDEEVHGYLEFCNCNMAFFVRVPLVQISNDVY